MDVCTDRSAGSHNYSWVVDLYHFWQRQYIVYNRKYATFSLQGRYYSVGMHMHAFPFCDPEIVLRGHVILAQEEIFYVLHMCRHVVAIC